MPIRYLFRLLLAITLFGGLPASGLAFDLTVFHTNDNHAAYGGFTSAGAPCYAALCEGGSGGSVRLYQYLQTVQRDHPEDATMLLDAGDQFQGTLFYMTHKSRIAADVLNFMEYTAAIPGNHEFDDGCGEFLTYIDRMTVPVLAANCALPSASESTSVIISEKSATNQHGVQPWIVVERQGRRIGIVGLVTETTPTSSSPCSEARFLPAEPALQTAVKELQTQGVNIIIALTHRGLGEDERMAAAVDGVDIIVGGHTHSLLSNTDKTAEGPYPVVVRSPSGAPVLVVTAKSNGTLLGKLRVTFDNVGVATAWNGEPVRLNEKENRSSVKAVQPVPFDPALMAMLTDYAEPIQALLQQQIGSIDGSGILDEDGGRICRVRECRTGNLIVDSMLAATSTDNIQVALTNGGAVRASLRGGEVTTADTLAVIPFENHLYTGTVSGQTLLDMLEFGVSAHENGGGRFLQVSGIRMVINPALPVGKRLIRAEIQGEVLANDTGAQRGDTANQVWSPVDPRASYRIVIPDFLARGGDGFALLSSVNWKDTGIMQNKAFAEYIATHSPLTARIESRIVLQK